MLSATPTRIVALSSPLTTVQLAALRPRNQGLSRLPFTSIDPARPLAHSPIVQSHSRPRAGSRAVLNRNLERSFPPHALSQLQRQAQRALYSASRFQTSTASIHPVHKIAPSKKVPTSWNHPNKKPITPVRKMSFRSTSSSSSSENESSDISTQPTPMTTPSNTPDFTLDLAKHGLSETDLQDVHDLLVEIALEGGKTMLEAEHEFLIVAATKNNTSDIVTKYDSQIEAMVENRTRTAYPHFSFLGEETFKHGTKLSDTPTFVCDPIDGTLNFSRGVPNCAISLALTLDKKPVVGVVYNPFRGDMYTAIKNKGAFLTKTMTGTKIKLPMQPIPPPLPNLNACLVAVEWGNQRSGPNWALRTDVHKKLLTSKSEGGAMCRSVRSNGSAALDFCYVAQGILDAFWEGGVWVWDVCAGWIILEEAGGLVASANPGDWDPSLEGRLYFAVRHAKREEQKNVVEELWEIMGERKFEF